MALEEKLYEDADHRATPLSTILYFEVKLVLQADKVQLKEHQVRPNA